MGRFVYILLFILGISLEGYAQQLPLYSQYKLSRFPVNPAMAGASGYNNINITARRQWLSFKEAPHTQIISWEYRLLKKNLEVQNSLFGGKTLDKRNNPKMGFGGLIFNDKNGNVGRKGMNLSYAYHIKLRNSQLSFGVATNFYSFSIDMEELEPAYYDPILQSNSKENIWATDATIGALLIIRRNLYIGLSCNEILQSFDFGNEVVENYQLLRHYYYNMGYHFALSRENIIETSLLVKFNEWLRYQVDISGKFYYQDKYWGGVSYRDNNNLIFFAGFYMTDLDNAWIDKISLSYSFDYGLNEIIRHSFGSHEINLGFIIGYNDRRLRWRDRFF